jgi:hypothetical protein
MRRPALLLFFCVAACTSNPRADTPPDPQPDGAAGDPCVTNAGCGEGLVCTFGYCRIPLPPRDAAPYDSGGPSTDSAPPVDAAPDVSEAGVADGGPSPACVVKDVANANLSFGFAPSPLVAGPVTVTVTDQTTTFANVSLGFCTPNGLVNDSMVNVVSSLPPYKWKFGAVTLPSGTTQVRFVADPNKTVYATHRILIP